MIDRLALARAEIVARTGDDDEIDARILTRDALEHGHRTELVVGALHDEGAAAHARERGLVARARAVRRRDGMANDRERIRWLDGREQRAHPAAEAAPDERDEMVRGAQLVPRRAKIAQLALAVAARSPAPPPEFSPRPFDAPPPQPLPQAKTGRPPTAATAIPSADPR